MPYPKAGDAELERFRAEGYLVVRDALLPRDLERLQAICDDLLENREKVAFDWAWEAGTDRDKRKFKIVQTSPSLFRKGELENERFRTWATDFASALLGRPVEFWYDQFLAKPPEEGARTPWHQDEAYWGRNLDERGITCWLPFHDVDVGNGCMHFVPGAHREGVLEHRSVDNVQSDLLVCEVDPARVVAAPIRLGDVTFHHGKMPHMTTPNVSTRWRRALSQHFRVVGSKGEGDHYPWKIYVNQFTGQRTKPNVR
ncbi:MAG TPA: phytanoyl-CoA dioxygenase family protein [Myxococcota bacterium]|nr:phytanoyl-CoA dioxygenase family protein [Myxococcota bacterium]